MTNGRRLFAIIVFWLFSVAANAATIDSITGAQNTQYSATNPSFSSILLFGGLVGHQLSDGTVFLPETATYHLGSATLASETAVGSTIRYILSAPGGLILDETVDPGTHSTRGVLVAEGPLVIEAIDGSTTATLSGFAKVQSNTPTGDPTFVAYSASVGSIVPFSANYTLIAATWHSGIFSEEFNYLIGTDIDLAHPIPEPSSVAMLGAGLALLLGFAARFRNTVQTRDSSHGRLTAD